MATVSILMPFKDPGAYFEECLDSIINQTYSEWELIAINDHSKGNSLELIHSKAQHDPRIRVIQNSDSGIINALITGLKISDGAFITRMDADDIMPKNRLELMTNAINIASKQTVVTGLVKYFSSHEVSKGYQKYEQWINQINLNQMQWSQIYRECVIASPNWMIRKDTLMNTGGFEGLQYPEDYDLVLRWFRSKLPILTVPEVTLYWREHQLRTSRNSDNYNQEAFFQLKINHFIQHNCHKGNIVLWGNNPKTKLVTKILTEQRIPFINHSIKDYRKLVKIDHPQLLVGVYPNKKERDQIEEFLYQLGLKEGKNWWWI